MTAACGVPEQFLMLIADLAGQAAQDRAVTVEIEQRQFRLDRKLRPLALGRTGIERVGAFKLVRVKAVQCYPQPKIIRSEEHTSELQSLMRISYAVFCLKKNTNHNNTTATSTT